MALRAGHERRAAALAKPKIVFIGGSSAVFGIDRGLVERESRRPVLVYGLHAGIGLDLIAEDALRFVSTGDTVVIVPEWFHFEHSPPQVIRLVWLDSVGTEQPGWEREGALRDSSATFVLSGSMPGPSSKHSTGTR